MLLRSFILDACRSVALQEQVVYWGQSKNKCDVAARVIVPFKYVGMSMSFIQSLSLSRPPDHPQLLRDASRALHRH
jgi:hypothetical protein